MPPWQIEDSGSESQHCLLYSAGWDVLFPSSLRSPDPPYVTCYFFAWLFALSAWLSAHFNRSWKWRLLFDGTYLRPSSVSVFENIRVYWRADTGDHHPQIWRAKRCLFSFCFQPLPTGLFSSPTHTLLKPTGSFSPLFHHSSCVCVCVCGGCFMELVHKLIENLHCKLWYTYFTCCS